MLSAEVYVRRVYDVCSLGSLPTTHINHLSLSRSLPWWWLAFRRCGGLAISDFHCDEGTGGCVEPRSSLHHLTFYNEQTCICIRANQPLEGISARLNFIRLDHSYIVVFITSSICGYSIYSFSNASWRILQKCKFFNKLSNFCIKIVWTITLTAICVFVQRSLRT